MSCLYCYLHNDLDSIIKTTYNNLSLQYKTRVSQSPNVTFLTNMKSKYVPNISSLQCYHTTLQPYPDILITRHETTITYRTLTVQNYNIRLLQEQFYAILPHPALLLAIKMSDNNDL